MTQNKFCNDNVFTNEASVETFFINRLLEDLGYSDQQIIPKTSIQELRISRGSRSAPYKPDYAIQLDGTVRWVLDAKAPGEELTNYIGQCSGYCLMINQRYRNANPVRYFVLSNGFYTQLYNWDSEEVILELSFADFVDGNEKYNRFKQILSNDGIANMVSQNQQVQHHILYKKTLEEVNAAFAWCHQQIYKKDAMSQSAAFEEFVKVVFLKLLSDRKLLRAHPDIANRTVIEVPVNEVKFSKKWIEEREADTPNPLDTIQFRELLNDLEREILVGNKKRIFEPNERILLSPETIKGVVEKLEDIFLFGIDADLNGRLFETFLNATMRGKDLGQFFTPRSVVKLGAKLARMKVGVLLDNGSRYTESVLDACCGTGGFLIEVLGEMWRKVDSLNTLTLAEKDALKNEIALRKIFGVDVGREPAIARIARMNMYLHGDGGSSIFQADALDKQVRILPNDSLEIQQEKNQLRALVQQPGGFVDVVLTNPPFAKTYDRTTANEAAILDEYELAFSGEGARRTARNSLKSSLMFIERYYDLLKPGGRMITVIDDGILGGDDYRRFRQFIREKFIVRAVISLPGDAFQRSLARVKTSILILEKRRNGETGQPSVFMYPCRYVGIDDPSRQRVLPIDRENRRRAEEEIATVLTHYEAFLQGDPSVADYVVSGDRISDRMDVKSCLLKPNRNVDQWEAAGRNVIKFSELVDLVEFSENNAIDTRESDDFVTYLRVRYDGFAEAGDEILASDSTYSRLYIVSAGDIVLSNIGATYGSCAIVPAELDGCVVTNEFTIFRPKEGVDPRVIWMLLRTPEARANLLLLATGISRTRVKWENLANLILPLPDPEITERVAQAIREAEEMEQASIELRHNAREILETHLDLANNEANDILLAFKPPR
ncbi:N-6 DNA methylase [Paenibacillus flagellatus]|uniref:DNA methylase adenine-specific domain-containing protein n=1 Tax=Paenibacillus flagellatus TaxID=2211139 RepID=A0A2V5KTD3_9BACL|nr:N-6 DNA methylase [Paenibacillus flagellatus]PYI52446.1 hypothetical protein DLM86_19890 [Paenibacillus flagellatus]